MVERNIGTIEFELVSPSKLLASEEVDMVVVPGFEGDIGVLPGHSPLIATVRPGIIDIHENGKIKNRIFVGGGFAEVSPQRCTVLAEEAVPVAEIDLNEAEARLSTAKKNAESSDKTLSPESARHIAIAEGLVTAAKKALAE